MVFIRVHGRFSLIHYFPSNAARMGRQKVNLVNRLTTVPPWRTG